MGKLATEGDKVSTEGLISIRERQLALAKCSTLGKLKFGLLVSGEKSVIEYPIEAIVETGVKSIGFIEISISENERGSNFLQ